MKYLAILALLASSLCAGEAAPQAEPAPAFAPEDEAAILKKLTETHPRDEALQRGAAFLLAQQNKDGSFGPALKTAMTGLAVMALLTLAAVTPFPRLLIALGRLGVPPVLVATLHFMYRYLHVLGEELDRMVKARRSRTFRRSGRLDWGLLSGLLGMLFLRSMERGERVHAAMLARGWDGTVRTLDGPERPETLPPT